MSQAQLFPVQSEAEALRLLNKYRAEAIAAARRVAILMTLRAQYQNGITAQDVWQVMEEAGEITEEIAGLKANWLACVFKYKDSPWKTTGEYRKVGNAKRNMHAAPRAVWVLAEGVGNDATR